MSFLMWTIYICALWQAVKILRIVLVTKQSICVFVLSMQLSSLGVCIEDEICRILTSENTWVSDFLKICFKLWPVLHRIVKIWHLNKGLLPSNSQLIPKTHWNTGFIMNRLYVLKVYSPRLICVLVYVITVVEMWWLIAVSFYWKPWFSSIKH